MQDNEDDRTEIERAGGIETTAVVDPWLAAARATQ